MIPIKILENSLCKTVDELFSKKVDVLLEHPSLEEHGDYSTNVALILGKQLEKSSKKIADTIVYSLQQNENLKLLVSKIEVAGPGFINFWFTKEALFIELSQVVKEEKDYGTSSQGKGKNIVIDYSAPNIAKPFGIGHLRSTIIGQALYNLYSALGYKVIGDNHLGDWGTQFGKLLYMITKEDVSDLSIDKLEELYVEFHRRAEQDSTLEQEARNWFRKLEEGDKQAKELWQKCIDISMAEFSRIYDLLNVRIDYAYGESFYEKIMLDVIAEAKGKQIAKESNGAWMIDVPGIKAPLMLVKSDGATTYATRDLATLKFRKEQFHPVKVIYEVGAEQSLHFQQVFAAARLLGYVDEGTELIHTRHGLYRFKHGKMSTRKGQTVKLEKVLLEAISRAEKLGSKETSRVVGIGAIKYFDLKHGVQTDIIFDWEKMFTLEGDSGPYLQYTYARAKSVLKKSKETITVDGNPFIELASEELAILRYLYRFPEVIEVAAKTYDPNTMCTYLYELAKRFNYFYHNLSIIKAGNPQSKQFRLSLTKAISIVLQNGLALLGIEVLERM